MKQAWPMVPLGEVLTKTSEWVTLKPDEEYREVTVKLWGKGVIERRRVTGAEIAATERAMVRQGQFILSRIDARNGAFGLVPETLDGAVVSGDFPSFNLHSERILPGFLNWLSKTRDFIDLCIHASEGTTNRVRLKEDRFLATAIHLPPLAEQRRIAARIEELAAKIEEARALRQQAVEEAKALLAAVANRLFSSSTKWPQTPLGDAAEIVSGVTLGRTLTGRTIRLPYLRVANVQDGRLDLHVMKEVEIRVEEQEKWLLRSGDVLLTEGGDWDKLGRGTVWRGEIPECIHQNHIFRLRLNANRFDPDYVSGAVGSPFGKAYFQAASKQTTNLASINQRQLRAFPLLSPPIEEQRRIVAYLDGLQAEVTALKILQTDTAAELDALLPSLLDKAFKGEL